MQAGEPANGTFRRTASPSDHCTTPSGAIDCARWALKREKLKGSGPALAASPILGDEVAITTRLCTGRSRVELTLLPCGACLEERRECG
jgi:hypothetical protein